MAVKKNVDSNREDSRSTLVEESDTAQTHHDGYKFKPSKQAVLEPIQSFFTSSVAVVANIAAAREISKINPGVFGGIFAATLDTALYGHERIWANHEGAKLDIEHPIENTHYFKTLSGFAFDVFRFGLNVAAGFGGDLAGRTIATHLYPDDSSSDEGNKIVDTFGAVGNALAVALVAMTAKRIHNNCTNRTSLKPEEERQILLN